MRRWRERERRNDLRFGVLLSWYVNPKLDKNGRKMQPGEFFGHILPTPEQSDESMLAFMREFSRQYNRRREQEKQNDNG